MILLNRVLFSFSSKDLISELERIYTAKAVGKLLDETLWIKIFIFLRPMLSSVLFHCYKVQFLRMHPIVIKYLNASTIVEHGFAGLLL